MYYNYNFMCMIIIFFYIFYILLDFQFFVSVLYDSLPETSNTVNDSYSKHLCIYSSHMSAISNVTIERFSVDLHCDINVTMELLNNHSLYRTILQTVLFTRKNIEWQLQLRFIFNRLWLYVFTRFSNLALQTQWQP